MEKVPAYKRFLRVTKILLLNSVFFLFRLKKAKDLLNHIYLFDPHPQKEGNIVEISIEDLFPGIQKNKITLSDLESKYGSMTLEEIYNIAIIIKHLYPDCIFEFGTFIGVTTLQMALNSKDTAKIFTLNLPSTEKDTKYSIGNSEEERNLPNLQPGNRFEKAGMKDKITQLYGDSASYDFSDYKDKMDVILVDASHEYEYVKSDTQHSFAMMKQGGTLIWHDYPNAPGVYRYLNELSGKMKIYHLVGTHICLSVKFDKASVL
jgi:hypothetical protein